MDNIEDIVKNEINKKINSVKELLEITNGDVKEVKEYSEKELGEILKKFYDDELHGKVTGILLFGIKYGYLIKSKNYNRNNIIMESGINESYIAELNEGISLSEYAEILDEKPKYVIKDNTEENRVTGGCNIVYYGVPGTGKSFEIDKKLKDVSLDNKFRVTFHPEFTYNDFIGQLLPKVDKQTKSITYDFKEGEFTKALKRAYENPGEYVYLIIEEMSRGNCAAIFGDIFQLLDRNQDGDEKDWSTYAVNNELIASRINSRLIHNNMIKIPSNMYIYGTVNTSDQNVFVMDNAFKRRFEWRYISTNPKKDEDKYLNNINIKIYESKENGFDVEWVRLYRMLNMFISSNKYLDLGEDKQIGQFFIKFTEDDGKNFIKLRDKLLHYLWFDVQNASYRNECKLFDSNISNFSTLYDFFDNKEKIFSDEFIKILKGEY